MPATADSSSRQIPVRGLPANQESIAGFVKAFLRFAPSGYETIGSGREFSRVVNVYNYIDQLSWQTGNHLFKFGLDVRRYLFNGSSALPNEFSFGPDPGLRDGTLAGRYVFGPAQPNNLKRRRALRQTRKRPKWRGMPRTTGRLRHT